MRAATRPALNARLHAPIARKAENGAVFDGQHSRPVCLQNAVMNDDRNSVTLAQSLKAMQENMVALIEFERINAKLTREKFLALVAQGFTEEQALALCKK